MTSVGNDEVGMAGGSVEGGGEAGPARGLVLGGPLVRGPSPSTLLVLLLRGLWLTGAGGFCMPGYPYGPGLADLRGGGTTRGPGD